MDCGLSTIYFCMTLFDRTAHECSKLITQRYSTSFTLGIQTLSKRLRLPVYAIYGFVRFADEIVDTFHEQDKQQLLQKFKEETYGAIQAKISLNPVLHAFQMVVNQYLIENDLIEAFFKSMEMDLEDQVYTEEKYREYIYGSAEVVGLMCLKVFCKSDKNQYTILQQPAKRLGAAFQKVNFLRDIESDYKERGRIYFPGVNFSQFNQQAKSFIEKDIQQDFDAAYEGIIMLPKGAKLGVYLAFMYYSKLFNKIKRCPPSQIAKERIRIPNTKKAALLVHCYMRHQLNLL